VQFGDRWIVPASIPMVNISVYRRYRAEKPVRIPNVWC